MFQKQFQFSFLTSEQVLHCKTNLESSCTLIFRFRIPVSGFQILVFGSGFRFRIPVPDSDSGLLLLGLPLARFLGVKKESANKTTGLDKTPPKLLNYQQV